jgi:hypothetical protein
VVLVDRWRHRWRDRTRLAAMIVAVELVILGLLTGYAIGAGESGFWVPLAVAAPLVVLELWYDMRSRGRRLVPELAGSVGIGAVAAAIALAGGETERVAWGLWVVMGARSIAAIPYVRAQILRTKSRPGPRWHSDLAQVVAVLVAAAAWVTDLAPGPAAIAIGVLAVFHGVAVRMPPRPAVVIGIQQTVLGILVIVATAVSVATAG